MFFQAACRMPAAAQSKFVSLDSGRCCSQHSSKVFQFHRIRRLWLASQRCGHIYQSPHTFPIGMSRAWPTSGTVRSRPIRHTSGRLGDLGRSRRIPLVILHFDSDSVGDGNARSFASFGKR